MNLRIPDLRLCYVGFMRVWRALGVASVWLLAACSIDAPHFVPWDAAADSDSNADALDGYRVGGTVAGMWEGAGVSLRLTTDAGESTKSVSQNGDFQFNEAFPDGTSFTVSVATQPPQHTCVVGNATGETDGDVTNVEVVCEGPIVDIELSPLLEWTFDLPASAQMVMTSVVMQETPVTVTSADADTILLGSTELTSGVASAPVALHRS